ncbi:MAG: BMP family lipoprotein, partial [Nocardioidaceae bacterium]
MRHATKIAAVVGASALLVAGCGQKPGTTAGGGSSATKSAGGGETTTSAQPFNACMVLDTGGVDDHSFNQSSWAGMQAAKADNPNIKVGYVSSNSQNDYTPNLNAETNKSGGCNTVIAVGGLMGQALAKVAKANPNQHYAEIDSGNQGLSNVYGLQYNTAQGAFLGGYLAAAMTKTQ